ncbi:Choline transporter [Ceratobasidium theobromae]|uniref:Choline transporter n=1 Tax=Ceratobasidium theobromae TaxID=1582974 RepID=A0A5N5QGI4_9AGAM|nr:Choline transporter [Ceratobasidium theobromae]
MKPHSKETGSESVVPVSSTPSISSNRISEQHGMERQFSFFSIIGLAFAILNSWTAMAASLNIVLPSGGPVAMLWGLVVSAIGALCLSASLAEICHIYPTSGGPYHWSAMLAPSEWAPLISWVCGWFAVTGWWALVATTGSLAGSLITGIIALLHPNYEVQRWHMFLIFEVWMMGSFLINTFGIRLLPTINRAALTWSITGVVVISITCLACASPTYQSPQFVFRTYINESGWNNGVAWILGLLQSAFGLTGFDAVSHIVEEMPSPHIHAPRAMILAVLIGATSGFAFLIVLLFCLTDVDAVIASPAGALLEIIYQATGSRVGAVCLLMFPVVSMAFAGQGIMTGASRMAHAFARDNGLPFSPVFARINSRFRVPLASLVLTTVLCVIFGCIYLGSSSALNAILSSSVVALNISYSIPVALLLIRGRHLLNPPDLPAPPTFTLGHIGGPIANIIGLAFAVITTVFFLLPPELPVTPSNMNYTIVVFGIITIVSATTWAATGRHHFKGPLDMEELLRMAFDARRLADMPMEHPEKPSEFRRLNLVVFFTPTMPSPAGGSSTNLSTRTEIPGSEMRTPRGAPAVLTEVSIDTNGTIAQARDYAHMPGHYPSSIATQPTPQDSLDDFGGVGGLVLGDTSPILSSIPNVHESPTTTLHSYGTDSFVSTDSAPPTRLRRASEIAASRQMSAPKALEHGSTHRGPRTPKRIIVCCDGTWQDGLIKRQSWMYSNVLKLARCLHHEDQRYDPPIPQIVFYQSGIGSEQNPYSRFIDGATGASLAEKVQEAYAFIAHNYFPGDEVFLFGFSRGAYTARMVAGFIGSIGILDRTAMDSFADIFIAMQKKCKAKDAAEHKRCDDALAPFKEICDDGRRRADFNHDKFTIKCVGVWDTVGSMGLPTVITGNSAKMHQLFDFPDDLLGPHVERGLHAMSLNEDREDFQVTKFHQTKKGKERGQQLKQVWFAGQHSDVGGGWQDHDLSDIALMWMIANIEDIVSIDVKYCKALPRPVAEWGTQLPHSSQSGIYKFGGKAMRQPSIDPATHEQMHPSVKMQGWLTPAAGAWIENYPDRFVPLLPLEQELRENWGYRQGFTPKRVDTRQAQKEFKNEQTAVKGLIAMASKALRTATQTEVLKDEGGRSVYEDSWVGRIVDEIVNKKDN